MPDDQPPQDKLRRPTFACEECHEEVADIEQSATVHILLPNYEDEIRVFNMLLGLGEVRRRESIGATGQSPIHADLSDTYLMAILSFQCGKCFKTNYVQLDIEECAITLTNYPEIVIMTDLYTVHGAEKPAKRPFDQHDSRRFELIMSERIKTPGDLIMLLPDRPERQALYDFGREIRRSSPGEF